MECASCGSCGEWGGCPQCGRDLEKFLENFRPDYNFPIECPEIGHVDSVNLLEDLIEKSGGEPMPLLEDPKQIGLWIFHNVAIVELNGDLFQTYLKFREKTGAQVVFQAAEFPFECPIPDHAAVWVAEEDLSLARDHGLPVITHYHIDREGVYAADP